MFEGFVWEITLEWWDFYAKINFGGWLILSNFRGTNFHGFQNFRGELKTLNKMVRSKLPPWRNQSKWISDWHHKVNKKQQETSYRQSILSREKSLPSFNATDFKLIRSADLFRTICNDLQSTVIDDNITNIFLLYKCKIKMQN